MTLVLLDTNVYLRIAKRIRPLLGTPFADENYEVVILRDVEDEVHRNNKLLFYNPWFDNEDFVNERLATRLRLTEQEKVSLQRTQSILHGSVKGDMRYLVDGRHPPSPTDCRVLAFSQIRPAIIVTDDIGMHILAGDFGITVWHGYELIKRMLDTNKINEALVREIYEALENNGDMTKSWKTAKLTVFAEIFVA